MQEVKDCLNVQALLPLFPELLLQLPSRVFTATSLLILAYLGPAMWYLWMDLGTGNANFFYAITLLWAAWQVTGRLCIDISVFGTTVCACCTNKLCCNVCKKAAALDLCYLSALILEARLKVILT